MTSAVYMEREKPKLYNKSQLRTTQRSFFKLNNNK